MQMHSESENPSLRDKIIGLGERSVRKSYYPELRRQLDEAEKSRSQLVEKSAALRAMLEDLEKARSSLTDSEARYRSLVENINDVIFSVDLKGTVTYISPVILNISGQRPDEIIGQHFQATVHPEDQAAWVAGLQRVLAGQMEPHEFRLHDKTGGFRQIRASCRPLEEEGRVVGLTGVLSDITERKQAEEEIRQLNQELEQRVQQRTAQLEATNKELEAFAYSVSHDLRAPLRHIDGYVDLLLSRCRDELSEQGLGYVDTIASSARRMGHLIDDLLEFSRTGRAEMRQEKVEMNRLLQEVLIPIRENCAGRTIEWVVGDLPSVEGDGSLLHQVWVNLLENAVKYTQSREAARIEVGTREENNEKVFFVADNGVGFDMHYAGKLFGVFQRLHSREEFEGTGIGLATVHRIITRHGGRIWAESEVDRGATFFFTLPNAGSPPDSHQIPNTGENQ